VSYPGRGRLGAKHVGGIILALFDLVKAPGGEKFGVPSTIEDHVRKVSNVGAKLAPVLTGRRNRRSYKGWLGDCRGVDHLGW
jgi:hypothetical protein